MAEIVIVDDEKVLTAGLQIQLKKNGHTPVIFHDGATFTTYLESSEPDLVFLDLKLPDTHGLDILSHIQHTNPTIPTVIITAHGNMESAIKAMRMGAHDYLNKPFDLSEIDILINNVLSRKRLTNEVNLRRTKAYRREGLCSILGNSPAIRDLMEKIRRLGGIGETTVLIRGESGTGKELVAKGIHNNSKFENEQFIDINCASLPETLLESELFGHEKGAFTDAGKRKTGLVEMADGGTLFLDEIGEISLSLQAKLLRFLETKKFRRVGGTRELTFRGLIITATNSELEKAVTAGEFREDLYYRLNVVPLVVPPLRDRNGDIRLISQYYIDHFADKFGKHRLSFSPNAWAALDEYPWPGNVRELKNMMEMLAVMCDGPEISLTHLPPALSSDAAIRPEETPPTISLPLELLDASLAEQMAFLESRIIDRALEKSNGVKTEAASILGISRFTLLRR
ncbi:MAG: sigma-54 dependent transcriptional regulator, partial [Desulfobacterales bacterium]|nr:sigma-54 dependent transcriptional regulator [Desulfobacterales bacterium]